MKNILYASALFFLFSFQIFSQTITPTGSLNVPRWFHETQLLYNGKVLVFGGDDCRSVAGVTVHASAQLYDVSTGSWTNTGSMIVPRTRFASVVLPNGNVMAIGGAQSAAVDPITATCEIYNVQTGTWSYAASMHNPCMEHDAIVLKNGKVFVSGGLGSINCELYDPSTNTWAITSSPSKASGYGSNLVLLADGRVLSTYEHDAEIYDPATETWTLLPSKLIGVRKFHSAVLINNGNVLITGSSYPDDQMTAELFNATTQTFTAVPPMTENRATSEAVLMDNGNVLAYGIGDFFNAFDTKVIEVYNPITNSWSSNTYNWVGTQAYSIVKLGNGKFLVSGGGFAFDIASTVCALIDQNLPNCTTPPTVSMAVSGQATCYGKGSTIALSTSESSVSYSIHLGSRIVTKVSGTGNALTVPITAENIQAGNNTFTVYAQKTNCPSFLVSDTARIVGTVAVTTPVITSSGTSICVGDSMKISAPAGYASYIWSNKVTSEFIYAKNAGNYSVGFTTAAGCKSLHSNPIAISINPLVVPTISITTSQNPIIAGNAVTFTAAATNAGSAPIYQWKVNNITIANNSNKFSSVVLNDGDLVSCTLISNALCAKPASVVSNEITLIVNPFIDYPKIVSTFPASNALNVSASQPITFTFSKPMSDAAATDSIFAVYGSYSGKLKGVYTKNGNAITFTSNQYYLPGEKISVLIDSAAIDVSDIRMEDGYGLEFTATAAVAPATFIKGTDNSAYVGAYKLFSTDINNDGLIDIMSLNGHGLVLFLNKGNAEFAFVKALADGGGGSGINSADYNGDGFDDICVTQPSTNSINIHYNNQLNDYTKKSFSIPVSGEDVITGDFDGDADLDLAIRSRFYSTPSGISILWNDGKGNFNIGSTLLNNNGNSYRAADLDNDGDLDFLIANGNLSFLKNNGKGEFTTVAIPILQIPNEYPEIIAMGDFDENGFIDPVIAYQKKFGIIKNSGNGNFLAFDSIGRFTQNITHDYPVADFDGDEHLDLMMYHWSYTSGSKDTIHIWKNSGNGTLTKYSDYIIPTLQDGSAPDSRSFISADFDNDKDMDIGFVNFRTNKISMILNGGTKPSIANLVFTEDTLCASSNMDIAVNATGTFETDNVFKLQLSDKNGSFNAPMDLGSSKLISSNIIQGVIPSSIQAGIKYRMRIVSTKPYIETIDNGYDITIKTGCFMLTNITPHNHKQGVEPAEKIIASFTEEPLVLKSLLNVYGSFSGSYSKSKGVSAKSGNTLTFSPGIDFFTGEKIYAIADTSIRSTSGQKLRDPFVSSYTVKAKTSPAYFTMYKSDQTLINGKLLSAADLDNDRDIDAIIIDYTTDSLKFLLNNNDGLFVPRASLYIAQLSAITLDDYDNDGDADMAILKRNGSITLYRNDGHANFNSTQIIAATERMIKSSDINADGYFDLVTLNESLNKFDIFLNDGTGNFKQPITKSISEQTYSFSIDDMDADGDFDIVYGTEDKLVILYNYKSGTTFRKAVIASGNWNPTHPLLCDINNDNRIDIIGYRTALFNNADNSFTSDNSSNILIYNYLVPADFNGDNKTDFIASDGANYIVLLNTDLADFKVHATTKGHDSPIAADVDTDGDMDFIGYHFEHGFNSYINELNLKTLSTSTQAFCSNNKIEVPFTYRGVPAGTTFSAQLSDASGNFTSAQIIGTGKTSPIICSVLSATPLGTTYRIRIVCDSMNLVGTDNGSNLTITKDCPTVLLLKPASNSNEVMPTSKIEAIFNTDLLASSITSNTIRIFGNASGFNSNRGTTSLATPATAKYESRNIFFPGEKISVTLTNGIKNTHGFPFITPYVYEFNIRPKATSGNLVLKENTYINKTSGQSYLIKSGDLDNDGYMDLISAANPAKVISILLNKQSNSTPAVNLPIEDYLSDMCVFDIDADGDLDLLTAGSGAGVYVYKNDGSANFIQKYKLTLSTYPSNVYNADFDGDGDMDLVAVSMMGFSLIVNDGQGNFSEKTILNTVNKNNLQDNKNLPLKTLSIADIDLDGDMDILATATSNYSYIVLTFLNDGHGKFTIKNHKESGPTSTDIIRTADFNNDGKMDFVTTSHSSAFIIGLNTNDIFHSDAFYSDKIISAIEPVDIDGDGDIDLIIPNWNEKGVSTYKNNGSGSFTLFAFTPIGITPNNAQAIDIDKDGDLDIALTSIFSSDLIILYNQDASITSLPISTTTICGGSKFDVPFRQLAAPAGSIFSAQLSNASGSFANNPTTIGTGTSSPLSVTIPASIAAGNAYRIRVVTNDLTIIGTDNGTDLPFIKGCMFITTLTPGANSHNVASVNSVSANFTTDLAPSSVNAQSLRISGSYSGFDSNKGTIGLTNPSSITFTSTRNFFPNEKISVTLTNQIQNTNNIHLEKPFTYEFVTKPATSTGEYFLRTSTRTASDNFNLGSVVTKSSKTGDLDNDGDLDIATISLYTNDLYIYLNNGNLFNLRNTLTTGDQPQSLSLMDMDNDGDLDIFVMDMYTVSVFKNNGAGSFITQTALTLSDRPEGIATADFDGDGHTDFATCTFSTGLSININNGIGNFTEKTFPFITDGHAFAVKAIDIDADGDMDLVGTTFSPFHVLTFENDGHANFSLTSTVNTLIGAIDIQTADFNNDGKMDFITSLGTGGGGGFDIGLNQSGSFVMKHINSPYHQAYFQILDVDGDSDMDIVTSSQNYIEGLTILKNDGLSNFTVSQSIPIYTSVLVFTPIDIDNDGDVDIVCNNTDPLGLLTFYNGAAPIEDPISTGVTNTSLTNIRIYPNPTQDYINIESPSIIEQITLYNVLGNEVLRVEQANKINVGELSPGIYNIKIVTDNGTLIKKICIE